MTVTTWACVLAGVAIAVGVTGIVVPVLPGLILVWLAALVWGIVVGGPAGVTVAVIASALTAGGWVLQYVLPGRHLKRAGVPGRTTLCGAVGAVLGFFVIPVVGLPVGFVAGVYVAECLRLGVAAAWPSTRAAVRAALMSSGIELGIAVLIAVTWAVGVWTVLT